MLVWINPAPISQRDWGMMFFKIVAFKNIAKFQTKTLCIQLATLLRNSNKDAFLSIFRNF